MKVICLAHATLPEPTPLHAVKPGRVVCYNDLDGKPHYYITTKLSRLEQEFIAVPEGKRMLTNLETGRVVLKADTLLVYFTSCSADAYLTHH
jgi:hypothetical protein